MKILYDKLLKRLEADGYTMGQFKAKTGLSYETIRKIERRSGIITVKEIGKIYDGLGYEPTDIFEFIREPKDVKPKGKDNYKRTKIAQYNLDGVLICTFDSIRQVERLFKFCHGPISLCIHGERKTAYGFIWRVVHGDIPQKNILLSPAQP